MGSGMQGGMVNPFNQKTLAKRLECELLCCMMQQCASVVASEKPASIFNFVPRAWDMKTEQMNLMHIANMCVDTYIDRLKCFDFKLEKVAVFENRIALICYRESVVSRLIENSDVIHLLDGYGYKTKDTRTTIESMRNRLCSFYINKDAREVCCEKEQLVCLGTFPHEIGVLLGYPVDDVISFIEHEGKNSKLVGQWKVYHEVSCAQMRFERLKECERRYQKMFFDGMSLCDLIVLGKCN